MGQFQRSENHGVVAGRARRRNLLLPLQLLHAFHSFETALTTPSYSPLPLLSSHAVSFRVLFRVLFRVSIICLGLFRVFV